MRREVSVEMTLVVPYSRDSSRVIYIDALSDLFGEGHELEPGASHEPTAEVCRSLVVGDVRCRFGSSLVRAPRPHIARVGGPDQWRKYFRPNRRSEAHIGVDHEDVVDSFEALLVLQDHVVAVHRCGGPSRACR